MYIRDWVISLFNLEIARMNLHGRLNFIPLSNSNLLQLLIGNLR